MLYFVRHGESEANLRKVFAGQLDDSPLTGTGRRQAKEAGAEMKRSGLEFDHIIASPLDRTKETATIIAVELGLAPSQIQHDARLLEYDMGDFTGQPIPDRFPSSHDLVTAPHAEDPAAFQERVAAAIGEYRALPGNTLIVSHAGVGRMIEASKRGLPAHNFYNVAPYPNASLVTI
jgi:broad specificity phosphatase PhoE